MGGGPPSSIAEHRQRWLTTDDVLDLEATVKRSGVWRADRRVNSLVVDDATVVLEAVQPGTHRVHIIGASAMDREPVHALGDLLRTMSGIDDLEK